MDKFLTFTIVGLTVASIYAIFASGLVLTYTTTGIFNFAHGAAGMLFAFTYWQLRFDWGWPAPVALAVVLLVLAPLFGVLLELVIMRGLQNTTEAVKLVVSISLLLFLIGFAQLIWEPGVSRPMQTFFSSSQPINLGPTTITVHQAITIAVAILVAVGLRLLLTRTRIGIAMRAAVDDRSLSTLNGARPDRISMLAWAIGTSLAALGGILIAPGLALDAASLSLADRQRLRRRDLRPAAQPAADLPRGDRRRAHRGLPLGVPPAEPVPPRPPHREPCDHPLHRPARAAQPAPARPPTRSREFFPMPSVRGGLTFAGAMVAFGVVLATTLSTPDQFVYGKIFSIGIVALSLVPLVGFAGQISLCQLSFAGIGAVVMAHLGASGDPLALLWAVLIAAAVGAVVALPALRLSGIYLALGTAAFAVVLDRWIWNLPKFEVFGWFQVNLFAQGSVGVQPLKAFGTTFDKPDAQIILTSIVFALIALLVIFIRRGRLGRRLLAMKDSEAACATLGLNLLGTKLLVFSLSAGIAGLGGALYAMQLTSIQPGNFDLVSSLQVFALSVVGGIGAVGGALFGAISLFAVLPLIVQLWPGAVRWVGLLPGLTGIGLGRNPNGAVDDIREGFLPLLESPPALIGMVIALVGLYVLRITDVITNWPYVVLSLATPVVATIVAGLLKPEAVEEAAGLHDEVLDVPLEWRGIDRRWNEDDLEELDRAIGLEEVTLHGAP